MKLTFKKANGRHVCLEVLEVNFNPPLKLGPHDSCAGKVAMHSFSCNVVVKP